MWYKVTDSFALDWYVHTSRLDHTTNIWLQKQFMRIFSEYFCHMRFASQAAVHQTNSESHLVLYWSMKEHKDKVADACEQRKCQLTPSHCWFSDLPGIKGWLFRWKIWELIWLPLIYYCTWQLPAFCQDVTSGLSPLFTWRFKPSNVVIPMHWQ